MCQLWTNESTGTSQLVLIRSPGTSCCQSKLMPLGSRRKHSEHCYALSIPETSTSMHIFRRLSMLMLLPTRATSSWPVPPRHRLFGPRCFLPPGPGASGSIIILFSSSIIMRRVMVSSSQGSVYPRQGLTRLTPQTRHGPCIKDGCKTNS